MDFGNPVIKIAIECDGAQYHDAGKDAKRDAELLEMGWRVIRIPGWKCLKTGEDANEEDTTIPIIRALHCYFEGRH
ncbi:uncharacterized protein DUF559 [Cupriavidus phytorum]|uniref:Uncharacterized protein DUF559 n=1 Tax=Cupriavidus phytorum TaxID=3024399 RepID=A0A2W7PS57_9BURK|nr:DUF559 domain-containing protein [Cupriavidus alkaliphilus]PZX29445.1 uncharacterized protein DUF559 [Cupriavidus alkaliphilus]